jgi:bifunctional lysine-specific demethylase and histidyl-hydroxylase NO66
VTKTAPCLTALLYPTTLEEFFGRYYEREALHVQASSETPLVTHDALHTVLTGLRSLPRALIVFPERFEDGVATAEEIICDASRLDAYLAAGLPLVWNNPAGIFPLVDALASELGAAFGARVWPNVYATGTASTPFGMHFDTHEVLAVHCEGLKRWRISSVRAEHPLDDEGMNDAVRDWMVRRADDAECSVAHTFDTAAGDVVYVPRGAFHNARTISGRSLHVTFGIRCLTGHDAARLLVARALNDPALRSYAPPPASDPDGTRASAWARDMLVRLGGHLLSEDFLNELSRARGELLREQ